MWQICTLLLGLSPQGGAVISPHGNILGEEIHFGSLALDGTRVTTPSLDFPSQTQVKSQGSEAPFPSTRELAQPENSFTNQISTLFTTLQPNETGKSKSDKNPVPSMSSERNTLFYVGPEVKPTIEDLPHQNYSPQEDGQKSSWEPAAEQSRAQQTAGAYKYLPRTASWSGSASLPRGYRRSDGSSRLSSAITARPFGTKQSRVSSLPRMLNVSSLVDAAVVLLLFEMDNTFVPICLTKANTPFFFSAARKLNNTVTLKHAIHSGF